MEKQIIHVYKPESFGFADYLRAVVSLSDLAKNFGYKYTVAMNHPMSDFFEIDTTPYITETLSIEKILEKIRNKSTPIILESNYTDFTIKIPKNLVQNYIRPLPELKESVQETLEKLKLKKQKFLIFHARNGDEGRVEEDFLRRIKLAISALRLQRLPILFISSSQEIKKTLSDYPGVIMTSTEPCHTSQSNTERESLKNTLIEFYIMEYTKKIYSISGGSFGRGSSGFSYWASKIFSVPYSHFE